MDRKRRVSHDDFVCRNCSGNLGRSTACQRPDRRVRHQQCWRLRRNADRAYQFHRDLRTKLLRRIGWVLHGPDRVKHFGFRVQYGRRLRRPRHGPDQSGPASIRRHGQQHASLRRRSEPWRRPTWGAQHHGARGVEQRAAQRIGAHGSVAPEVFAASRTAYSGDGPMRLGLRRVFGRIACRRALWPLT